MTLLYSEIRDSLKTGDLVSWNTNKFNSFFTFILFLYQKILNPRSTHVAVIINMGGRILVVEAVPPAVRIYPLSMLTDFSYIKTSVKQRNSNLDILLREVGVKYGILDLIKGIIFEDKDKNELYCSELAYNFYKEVGLLSDVIYEDAGILPDSLVEAIEEVTGNKLINVIIDRDHLDAI